MVDPLGDLGRVGAGFECGPVLVEPAVAGGQFLGDVGLGRLQGVERLGGQCLDGRFDPAGRERGQQPLIEGLEDLGLPQIHHLGVVDLVGQGVLLGKPAPVIGLVVVPVALHAASAVAAEQHAAKDVRAAGAGVVWLVGGASVTARGEDLPGAFEVLHRDQRLVYLVFGPDPGVAVVPAHLGGVAEGDVVDVQQDFVLALFVPHLAAGVARVGDDDAHGRFGPGDLAAVAVACRVAGRRGWHALPGEVLGDVEDAAPIDELREDPLHDQCVGRVRLQPFEALTVCGFGRVGVWPRIHQLVPVRWPAT
nr:hypothetical protein [Actinomadura darangshiensis]